MLLEVALRFQAIPSGHQFPLSQPLNLRLCLSISLFLWLIALSACVLSASAPAPDPSAPHEFTSETVSKPQIR